MAFTFVVETGSGADSTANSYVSVSEADDIITANIHADPSWTALTQDQRERLLVFATKYLDDRTNWQGYKTVTGAVGSDGVTTGASPLRWPRTGVCNRDGVLIGSKEIPIQLKAATAEVARYMVAQDRTVERDQDGLVRVKADVVEIEFLEGYRLPEVPNNVQYLLAGLGYIAGGGVTFSPAIR